MGREHRHRDTAASIVMLLSLAKSHPGLEAALRDVKAGQRLLARREYRDFKASKETRNCPVFVSRERPSSYKATQPDRVRTANDAVTPSLQALTEGNTRLPLATMMGSYQWLSKLGKLAGFEELVVSALLRRSHCVKEKLYGRLTSVQMMVNMTHHDGDPYLYQRVYAADLDPASSAAHHQRGKVDERVAEGLETFHSLSERLRAQACDEDDLEALQEAVSALCAVLAEGEEGD